MTFTELTWDDLEHWAGTRVVKRGKSYKQNVYDLCITADGKLLSSVSGTHLYATAAWLDSDGKLQSDCTCPYGYACKHAVATILRYLDALKTGDKVLEAEADDERFEMLDDLQDNHDDETPSSTAPAGFPNQICPTLDTKVDEYLKKLTKAELVNLIWKWRAEIPATNKWLREKVELLTSDTDALLKAARKAIREASAEPGWSRHWSDDSYTPDYEPVRKRLRMLLDAGHADKVVELGGDLLDASVPQFESSDDEGETGNEVADTMGIVFTALAICSKPDEEKLLWEVEARLREDYGFFDDLPSLWTKPDRFSRETWSIVADRLAGKLPPVATGKSGARDEFSQRYNRNQVRKRMVSALRNAGRSSEITEILKKEAPITLCYEELVGHLISLQQTDDAELWCRKGIEACAENWQGISTNLIHRLEEIADGKKDFATVSAYRALLFFKTPSVESYKELKATASKVKLWEPVREACLNWLTTGDRPDAAAPRTSGKRTSRRKTPPPGESTTKTRWPLPPTGLSLPERRMFAAAFPETRLLIELALYENRHEDAVALYEKHNSPKKHGGTNFGRGLGIEQTLAEAVRESHPEISIGIWQSMVEDDADGQKPVIYEATGRTLETIRSTYEHKGDPEGWNNFITHLRNEFPRKRSLFEVLDRIQGTKKDRRILSK